MHIFLLLLIFNVFYLSGWTVQARNIPLHPLKIEKTSLKSNKLSPGSNTELKLEVSLLKDHHAYSDQFRLRSKPPEALKIGNIHVNPIVEFYDNFTKKNKQGIEGSATISAVIEIPENVILGENTYQIELVYQACTSTYCHLPKTANTSIKIEVISADDQQKNHSINPNSNSETELSKAQKRGWLSLILFVFIAGLLTGFTPCIFPMIPITISVLHGHKKKLTHFQGFLRSCMYVFGIAITYVLLGLFAASTGSLFGSLLGHPLVASLLAVIFFMMAISMFGAFEIKLPSFIESKLLSTKTDASYKGIFIAGLLAGIVASPCVGPVLVSILTLVAQSQDLILGAILLFTFALGFGSLFILLGTFGEVVKKLPKAGHWMIEIKELFGWIMIGLAMFYLAPVLSNKYWYLLLAIILISFSSILGAFTGSQDKSKSELLKKGWMLTFFIIGVFLIIKELIPLQNSISNPLQYNHKISTSISWQEYSKDIFNKAKQEGRGVIVDFYADWCAACKDLESDTFNGKEVQKLKDQFIWVKFDATQTSDKFDKLRKKYEILGLPHLVFYNPSGKWLKDETLTGFEDSKSFSERMKRVLSN